MTEPTWLAPDWREKFAAIKSEAAEKAKPLPGQELVTLRDVLTRGDIPDGARLDHHVMDAFMAGHPAVTHLIKSMGYIDHPNILRRHNAEEVPDATS
jgi:hypothetical protein